MNTVVSDSVPSPAADIIVLRVELRFHSHVHARRGVCAATARAILRSAAKNEFAALGNVALVRVNDEDMGIETQVPGE
jgi:hypothetical protein